MEKTVDAMLSQHPKYILQRCPLLEYRIDSIKCTYILTTIPSFCSFIPSKIESTYECNLTLFIILHFNIS